MAQLKIFGIEFLNWSLWRVLLLDNYFFQIGQKVQELFVVGVVVVRDYGDAVLQLEMVGVGSIID